MTLSIMWPWLSSQSIGEPTCHCPSTEAGLVIFQQKVLPPDFDSTQQSGILELDSYFGRTAQ